MARSDISSYPSSLAEGFYNSEVSASRGRPLGTFLPTGYERKYAYPLVVFLHGRGGNEEQILKYAPRLSRRNFICIGLRGPQPVADALGRPAFSWSADAPVDSNTEDYIYRAIEQTRRAYHVHSERIYLAGVGEGATLAYRLGLGSPERFAGIVALNGHMPRGGGPLFRFPDVRRLKVLIGHGSDNREIPLTDARSDYRSLYSSGIDVRFHTYASTHKIHPDMLRDMNRWIIGHLTDELDALMI
jgi:phospholipase/carboxylesterase